MDLEFRGDVFEWRGPAPYYFVALPEKESLELRDAHDIYSYGWGCVKVVARVDEIEWQTSLMPTKTGGYALPLKDGVRKPAGLDVGDPVVVRLTAIPASGRERRQPETVPNVPSIPRAPAVEYDWDDDDVAAAEGGRSGAAPRREGRGSATAQRKRRVAPTRSRTPLAPADLMIVPANEVGWEHLRAVFGSRGDPSLCWCQRFKMRPGESWRSEGPVELASRLRRQAAHGEPGVSTTSGLVAFFDGEPVGWCAVEPRSNYPRLLRSCRVPWVGRDEDKHEVGVWAVTCFVTRAGYRRRGISRALARAAVDYARRNGARAIEGYPDLVEVTYLGTRHVFADAGFVEVSRPTNRRAVMRIDF